MEQEVEMEGGEMKVWNCDGGRTVGRTGELVSCEEL